MQRKDMRRERPDPNMIPREDPYASPLGRGANPGPHADTAPLSGGPSIAGLRGQGVPGERGGPDGMVSRENEDVPHTARKDEAGGLAGADQP